MKKVLFLLCMVVCFVLTDKAYAQRCLPGMRGIRVTGGMVDGFHSPDKRNELGYSFGLSLDTYTRHCNRWVFGAEYLQSIIRIRLSAYLPRNLLRRAGITILFFRMRTRYFCFRWADRLWRDMKPIIGEKSCSMTALPCEAAITLSMGVLYRWNWKVI